MKCMGCPATIQEGYLCPRCDKATVKALRGIVSKDYQARANARIRKP